ncbi:hypothetical [Yersinia pestis KIM10+]|uniref:Uncharacterized protein n=1 Tax=Yersinia pestis TaxID=632 RepID=Q8CL22_YERPE|nr:hypothetical [Yersinia pestis KIM10+]
MIGSPAGYSLNAKAAGAAKILAIILLAIIVFFMVIGHTLWYQMIITLSLFAAAFCQTAHSGLRVANP